MSYRESWISLASSRAKMLRWCTAQGLMALKPGANIVLQVSQRMKDPSVDSAEAPFLHNYRLKSSKAGRGWKYI